MAKHLLSVAEASIKLKFLDKCLARRSCDFAQDDRDRQITEAQAILLAKLETLKKPYILTPSSP